jgi:hypothetical protein
MRAGIAGALIGVVFGMVLCWTGMSDPDIIRKALLFQSSYMYFFFASAVGTGALGHRVLRRFQSRAVLTGVPLEWKPERPARHHVVGSLIFGLGWGISNACPGPIATQIGRGVPWAVFTAVGALGGVYLFLRRGSAETEPASDTPVAARPAAAPTATPVTAAG